MNESQSLGVVQNPETPGRHVLLLGDFLWKLRYRGLCWFWKESGPVADILVFPNVESSFETPTILHSRSPPRRPKSMLRQQSQPLYAMSSIQTSINHNRLVLHFQKQLRLHAVGPRLCPTGCSLRSVHATRSLGSR